MKPALELFLELQERIILLEKRVAEIEPKEPEIKKSPGRPRKDDMLVSRPGGMVQVEGDTGGAIIPLTHPSEEAVNAQ